MSQPFHSDHALLNVCLLKSDFFISSYPGKIVFGEINQKTFITKKRFIINRCHFCMFYKSIITILQSLDSTCAGVLIEQIDELYIWEVKKDLVFFLIEISSETVYKVLFTLEELNNLLDCFKELVFSSLLLRIDEVSFLKKLGDLELQTICNFADESELLNYLQKNCCNKIESLILVKMNLDVIILQHKLKKLVKTDYRGKQYEPMLT